MMSTYHQYWGTDEITAHIMDRHFSQRNAVVIGMRIMLVDRFIEKMRRQDVLTHSEPFYISGLLG